MKTVLYSGSYLEGKDAQGNDRVDRTVRYCNYYTFIKKELEFEKLYLFDNGSTVKTLGPLHNKIGEMTDKGEIEMYLAENIKQDHSKPDEYPYCWRALYYIEVLIAMNYKKIIILDTDGFVISKRLMKYIKELNSGWTSFWCPTHQFPDSSIHILCEDAFPLFFEFCKTPWQERVGKGKMENIIPFTHVEHGFNCDRYGEWNAPLTPDIDYYGQAGPDLKIEFKD